jgi:hypothetical protein
MMWNLFLAAHKVVQPVQTVSSGITRWKFITRLRSTVAITIDLAPCLCLQLPAVIGVCKKPGGGASPGGL